MLSFFLNGFGFATWLSRIPEARRELSLSNSDLGLLLLAIAAGSVLTLPTTGALINRWGTHLVVRLGVLADVAGLGIVAVGAGVLGDVTLTAAGLFLYGLGAGVWDVGMNVEGAAVERALGRSIMPRFHAGFSLGTVAGAGLGALTVWVGLGLAAHLGLVAAAVVLLALATTGAFLPAVSPDELTGEPPRRSVWAAWREPRTLVIGLMVFALALTEGTANDWLAVALIDGHRVEDWVGVTGFALFVLAMTAGRVVGPVLLERYGRVHVLRATMATAGLGVLLIVLGGHVVPVTLGIALWGLGASLGFPVGISAASDEALHAAARVSVVSTIAYTAFLAGPPLLGFVADRIGTLHSLLVVAVLLVPSLLVAPAAREPRSAGG